MILQFEFTIRVYIIYFVSSQKSFFDIFGSNNSCKILFFFLDV